MAQNKKWNRKRKAEEKEKKAKNPRPAGDDNRVEYTAAIQKNAKMESFYGFQGLFDSRRETPTSDNFVANSTPEEKEAELQKFLTTLRGSLPASFRLNTSHSPLLRSKFLSQLEQHAGRPVEITVTLPNETTETRTLAPATPIPFIPHAFQLSVDRRTIRKNEHLQEFHEWLKLQSDAGFLTRQETVSMIPPVCLDVQPHHAVLDMCAAPGSKTSQILEIVTSSDPSAGIGSEPKGYVVANDCDPKRAYMLVHQIRRINSPAVFVTSVEAQYFPGSEGLFDRVLCDVPCGGDGTIRKNPGIWKNWNAGGGLSLHALQIQIALRGCSLLKIGGLMVYSTCSMNPMENEAVVAEILRVTQGRMELVDRRKDLKGIVAREGWTDWQVLRPEKREKKNSPKNLAKQEWWRSRMENRQEKRKKRREEGDENMEVDGDKKEVEEGSPNNNADNIDTNGDKKDGEEGSPTEKGKEENKEESEPAAVVYVPPPEEIPPSWAFEDLKSHAQAHQMWHYPTYEDVPQKFQKRLRKSCFPPTPEENEKFHLKKCMRVLPQDMDTGGFFVAIFRKNESIKTLLSEPKVTGKDTNATNVEKDNGNKKGEEKEVQKQESVVEEMKLESTLTEETKNDATVDDVTKDSTSDDVTKTTTDTPNTSSEPEASDPPIKKDRPLIKQKKGKNADLSNSNFTLPPPTIFPELIEFYGLSPDFPIGQIMARSHGKSKVLHFLTKSITDLIALGIQDRITVINSGLKAFEKCNKECTVYYRINQEGVHYIAPYMNSKRKLSVSGTDMMKCLQNDFLETAQFSEEFQSKTKELENGAFLVCLKGFEDDVGMKMMAVMWKCHGDFVDCMVGKKEIDGLRSKLRAVVEELGEEIAEEKVETCTATTDAVSEVNVVTMVEQKETVDSAAPVKENDAL